MGKKKLRRFADLESFEHVIQPSFDEIFNKDFKYKGSWGKDYFCNNNPIILELGCGKGEYTIGLARKYFDKNFIGIDIKGARIWKGAFEAKNQNLKNAAFIRSRIELINAFFNSEEISEIWLTFPDPQLKKRQIKKRLTSSRFLNYYSRILKTGGYIHLKTDSEDLFEYTRNIIRDNKLELSAYTKDLYRSEILDEILSIKSFYEEQFLSKEKNIYYIKFKINNISTISEPYERE